MTLRPSLGGCLPHILRTKPRPIGLDEVPAGYQAKMPIDVSDDSGDRRFACARVAGEDEVNIEFDLWQAPSPGVLFGTARHRLYSFYCIGEGAANLALSLLLVRRYGILGVAVGTLVPMTVVRLLVQPIDVCRVLGISPGRYYLRLGRTVFSAGVSLVVPGLLAWRLVGPGYLRLALLALASGVLYLAGLMALEFDRDETRGMMRKIAPLLRIGKTASGGGEGDRLT